MSRIRLFSALTAVVVASALLAACGGDSGVPGNAVATVKGTPITKTDFAHWMAVASIAQQGQAAPGAKVAPAVPVPPDYTACIAKGKAALPKKLPKGQKPVTAAQLKTQCATQYNALRDQVLQFLISAQWIAGEAKNQGITVTDAQVAKDIAAKKKQYPKPADFTKALAASGMTTADFTFQTKVTDLSTKLQAKVSKGAAKPTDASVRAYYNKNKAKFGTPETRDIKIVLTKTEAQATAAKKALESGQDFAAVAKKYSIDAATKSKGGVLAGVTKGQQEKALDTAVFGVAKASSSKVYGPIKTQFGYYVFEVTKITPAVVQTLQQATPQIKTAVTQANQQKVLAAFVKTFQKQWKGDTDCRKGYNSVEQCKNQLKTKTATTTTPTPAPTATTQ